MQTILPKFIPNHEGTCNFCLVQTQTISHLFYECALTSEFLGQLINFLLSLNVNIDLNLKQVLFGDPSKRAMSFENLMILYIKGFIWQCKIKNAIPTLRGFKSYLKLFLSTLIKTGIFMNTFCRSDMYGQVSTDTGGSKPAPVERVEHRPPVPQQRTIQPSESPSIEQYAPVPQERATQPPETPRVKKQPPANQGRKIQSPETPRVEQQPPVSQARSLRHSCCLRSKRRPLFDAQQIPQSSRRLAARWLQTWTTPSESANYSGRQNMHGSKARPQPPTTSTT